MMGSAIGCRVRFSLNCSPLFPLLCNIFRLGSGLMKYNSLIIWYKPNYHFPSHSIAH
jgi:hypothetical protein